MQKDAILNYFQNNFTSFYVRYLPDLKRGKANCPFHENDSKALSVDTSTGLFNCHGCGASGDIFRFFALKHGMNGNFPAVLEGIAADFCICAEKPKSRIIKTYDYTDQDGKLLYQVCRFEPKSFRPRRPDGRGGWAWDMKGVERVLYRQPEVLAADEVWATEGEKDADNLVALGIVATTNAGGAESWRPEYADTLKGKHVYYCGDQDEAGRKHAARVLPSLKGVAAGVKVIELPPGVKDVSDFIEAQPDPETAAERLAIMAEGAVEWTPPAESEPTTFQFIHNADILKNLRPTEWRIRDILTDCSFYYDFGDPGHFKTFIGIDRLLSIATGISYHGHVVKQGTVFYIAGEGQQGIGRRIAAWHISHGTRAAEVPFFVAKMPTQLMDLGAVQDVRRAIDAMSKEYGLPAVVHLDTLARNFGDGDENATRDMNAAISNLDKAFGTDFCRGITHHTGHGNKDRARGSIALHGAADCAFRVSLTDAEQIVVECKKMKDAPPAPLMVFSRRELLLQIGEVEDRSYVLDLEAEGDEAGSLVKPKKAVDLKGSLGKAVGILRNLYERYQNNLKKSGRGSAKPMISYADWRTACMDSGLYKRTDSFKRAFDIISTAGIVELDKSGRFVYLKEIVEENEY